MGLVLLDLTFRTERAFKVSIPKDWPQRIGLEYGDQDATLEQWHQLALALCREQDVAPPKNSWDVVVQVVIDTCGIDGSEITSQTRLIKDIAPYG